MTKNRRARALATPVHLDTVIHAPDSIRAGVNPETATVREFIDATIEYYGERAGAVLADVCDRAGINISDDDFDLHLDSPEVAEHLTLADIQALLDDPNARIVPGHPETPGEKLKAIRKILGLNQQELADRLGNSRDTIAQWEADKRPVQARPEELDAIAADRIAEIAALREVLGA